MRGIHSVHSMSESVSWLGPGGKDATGAGETAGAVESADESFCLQKAMKELGKLGEEINLLKKK